MELRKFIVTTIREYLNEQQVLNEGRLSIPKTKLNGFFYHGSILLDDDDLFDEFDLGYSDWDAIWLADDEKVAEEFSDWHGGYDNEIKLVFRVKINVSSIADISYELSKRINEIWALSDFREAIPLLKQRGFNGWVTTGSLDRIQYNDIAIFNPNSINIQDVKMFIDNNWTDFMDITDAQELIEKYREEKKIKQKDYNHET